MARLHMLKSATDTICESFIVETDSGLIVIDGGFESEAETLYAHLRTLGKTVDAWFFTHPHEDHFGAFCRLMTDHADEICVKKLYCNFPDDETIIRYEPTFTDHAKNYLPWIRRLVADLGIEQVTMHKGDRYGFGDAEITVLREPDVSITPNFINNSSTVFRMDTNGKRVMFLGDLGVEGGRQLLDTVPPYELKSDYVQMAHHGQNGVERSVYEAISPDYCLWNTPTWLWDNMGPEGYDTGHFKTVIVRGWMSEIGVRKHYVNMNGPYVIDI